MGSALVVSDISVIMGSKISCLFCCYHGFMVLKKEMEIWYCAFSVCQGSFREESISVNIS